jgi:hypothetical protein
MPHANHRLAAREHLAEAAALHAEGALGAAVRRLRAAATAAISAVVEATGGGPDRRVLPPVALDALGRRGVGVARVRDVVHDLHLDCHAQDGGRATEFTSGRVAEAIAAVQALVDLTVAALPVAAAASARPALEAFAREVPAAPLGSAVPDRPGAWLGAARRRARRRRIRTALLSLVMAILLGGGATAAVIAGERNGPRSALDVMARAHGLGELPASAR